MAKKNGILIAICVVLRSLEHALTFIKNASGVSSSICAIVGAMRCIKKVSVRMYWPMSARTSADECASHVASAVRRMRRGWYASVLLYFSKIGKHGVSRASKSQTDHISCDIQEPLHTRIETRTHTDTYLARSAPVGVKVDDAVLVGRNELLELRATGNFVNHLES